MENKLRKIAPEDYLMHSGVQGMKWGVRRYQNKDGSLTPEGRKRYGYTGERYAKKVQANRELGMKKDLAEQLAYKSTNRNSKIMQGIRAWIAGSSAIKAFATAGAASALGFGAGTIALSIAAPAVTAAALTGYSVMRHFKNRTFHEDVRGKKSNSTAVPKTMNVGQDTWKVYGSTDKFKSKYDEYKKLKESNNG
jgi:hypothetical protein